MLVSQGQYDEESWLSPLIRNTCNNFIALEGEGQPFSIMGLPDQDNILEVVQDNLMIEGIHLGHFAARELLNIGTIGLPASHSLKSLLL